MVFLQLRRCMGRCVEVAKLTDMLDQRNCLWYILFVCGINERFDGLPVQVWEPSKVGAELVFVDNSAMNHDPLAAPQQCRKPYTFVSGCTSDEAFPVHTLEDVFWVTRHREVTYTCE